MGEEKAGGGLFLPGFPWDKTGIGRKLKVGSAPGINSKGGLESRPGVWVAVPGRSVRTVAGAGAGTGGLAVALGSQAAEHEQGNRA